jgi:hypothetical protein
MRAPFPFLIGSGRAGTTLLRAMLDSHPRMAVPPETYLITELLPRRAEYEQLGGLAVDRFLDDVVTNAWFKRWELTRRKIRRELDADPAGFADGIRAVYRAYARRRAKDRYGDKTPVYVYEIDAIAELFEEARFVHVIRDGRDVACSFMGQERMRPNGPVEAALLWRERVEAALEAGGRLGPDRYLELRYEDLLADPERELRRLCEFVELEYDPSMLGYRERAEELTRFDGGSERHRGVFMPPTRGLRRWQDDLSADAVEAFELVAGDLLERLSYPRATEVAPARPEGATAVLVGEVDRLRHEVEAVQRDLRGKVREAQAELRAERLARRRGGRSARASEEGEGTEGSPALARLREPLARLMRRR